MGWWSLGPEDEEVMEMPHSLPVRRVRGGAGRVPNHRRGNDHVSPGRKTDRTRSPASSKQTKRNKKKRPRVVGTPKEEESNLFASIGRMVNNTDPHRFASDLSTLGTAKYPGQNGIPVDALMMNNNYANEAQRRANEMANAMAWLTNPNATAAQEEEESSSSSQATTISDLFQDDSSENITPFALKSEEMPELIALLKHGQTTCSYNDNNNEIDHITNKKPAKGQHKNFEIKGKELTAEKRARDLQRSLEWLQQNNARYDAHEPLEEYAEEPFQTVDAGFRQWTSRTTPSLGWQRLHDDSRGQSKEAKQIAENLKQSLDLILNGDIFDSNGSSLKNGPVLNRLKDLFVEWTFRENDGSKELEDALSWCKLHTQKYDPFTTSKEEDRRVVESKKLLILLEFKEDDAWDERKQEMEEALALWAIYKDKSMEDIDDHTIEKMKKIKDVLVQIKRRRLTMSDMTYMAREMNGVLTLYLAKGTRYLKSLGERFDPLPDRRKDMVELLLVLEDNKCISDILDKYNGEDGARFQKLHDSIMDWKSKKGFNPNSNTIAMNISVKNGIEAVLDWFVATEENFSVATSNEDEVYMAQIAKSALDAWMIPSESSFQDSKFAVKEIKGALALYQKAFEEPEMLQELSRDIIKEAGINSQQVNPTDMSWKRKEAGHNFNESSEPIGVKIQDLKFDGVVPLVPLEEEKLVQEMSSALDWLRHNDAALDVDDVMSAAFCVATSKKIDGIVPRTGDVLAPTTRVDNALDWLRSKTIVDNENVSSSKKIDGVLAISASSNAANEPGFVGALEWLRERQRYNAASHVKGGYCSSDNNAKLIAVSVIPKTEDERKAEQMESALDWLRCNGPPGDISVDSVCHTLNNGFASASTELGINRPGGSLSAPQRELHWLRPQTATIIETSTTVSKGARCTAGQPLLVDDKRVSETTNFPHWFRRNEDSVHSSDRSNGESELGTTEASGPVAHVSNEEHSIEIFGTGQSWMRIASHNDCDGDDDDLAGIFAAFDEKSRMKALDNETLPTSIQLNRPDSPTDVRDDALAFNTPFDVNVIPRDDTPPGVESNDAGWSVHITRLFYEVPDERVSCGNFGMLKAIPFSRERSQDFDNHDLDWIRHPAIEVQLDDEMLCYCKSRDVRSIPCDGPHKREIMMPNIDWNRHGKLLNPIPGEEHFDDRPQDVRSVPCSGTLYEAGFPDLSWRRNPAWKINKTEDKGNINLFDHPGNLRSIPRSEKSNEEMYPSIGWDRVGHMKQEMRMHEGSIFDHLIDLRSIPRDGSPSAEDFQTITWERHGARRQELEEEDAAFYRPGDVISIPRDGNPCADDFPTMTWGRNGSRRQEDTILDGPCHLRSIPRDCRHKESFDLEFTWERQTSVECIAGMDHGNAFDQPRNLRSIPRDGHPHEVPDIKGERHFGNMSSTQYNKMGLELDWSGGRPNRLLTVEPKRENDDATYDWMITSPKGKDANYDWSGARPYERPETSLVSLSAPSIDVASSGVNNWLPDDLSEYTQLGEDKPRPITGVPCAAWTMLALGAAAGGAMTSGTAPQGAAVSSQFAHNNSVGSTTDRLYPNPGDLPNCSNDANCQIIMDSLSPVLPPDVLGLFDFPGTCQTKARDWLRTGKDILELKAERIRQRYAMSAFFCEMDGGDWITGDSWLSDLHECDWYNKVGLDPCNRREQMEMLRVTDNGLAGTLPVELFILSNLYEFTLANNLMSGTLPQLFDKFKQLDTLVIPFNQFKGSFPHQIWEYPDMVYLDVAYNGFTGSIPTDIDSRMPNLQVVFLENNNLSGPIPENLGNLKQLHRLHLDDNKFSGKIPRTLGSPPRISELLLHDNLLTGEVPKELGDLNRLQLLTLHYNSFDEQSIDEHICDLMYNKQLELVTVDKATINCSCCTLGEESFV
ncbi:unnamed protein product [Cylindrotheca closterium]|uniref:Uncharacterized protein n=1 Tax=Cylindrotheca closterium TaxID=2856 RepID=A0AAD2CSH4_9STRA|nr:unnamed protein product [Cylindrotheca closterium]